MEFIADFKCDRGHTRRLTFALPWRGKRGAGPTRVRSQRNILPAAGLRDGFGMGETEGAPHRLSHILTYALVLGSRLDLPWVLPIGIVRAWGYGAEAVWLQR